VQGQGGAGAGEAMTLDGREGGYIKLHRQVHSWPLWRSMTANQRMVWVELLFLANWKDDSFWYGTHRIEVKRGQLAHSEGVIAKSARVGRKVVRDAIEKLQAEGAVRREKAQVEGQGPYLITIVNYDKYQASDAQEGQVLGQGRARVGPGEGQGRALREEGEEGEEGKETTLAAAVAPLALVPEEAPRKRRKPGSPTDPRFGPLRAAWEAALLAERREPYRWLGAKDARGVHALIAVEPEEFAQRAHRALNAAGFARCSSVAQLAAKWNDLAGVNDRRTGPAPVSKTFDAPF
jgi:hypothetical protein